MSAAPYLAGLRSGFQRGLRSPGELAVRLGFYAIILVVFSALWRAAVAGHGGRIAGYSFHGLLWYVIAAEGAVIATKPRMIEEIGDEIGGGDVAVGLLRPVDYVGFRLSVELGEALVRLAGTATLGAVAGCWLAGAPPSAAGVVLWLVSAPTAVAANLACQHAFAAAAFWIEDARASWFLYQKLIFLLGGMLLPFELLPGSLAEVARALPFAAMAYAPARQLSGHPSVGLLLAQLAWVAVLTAAAVGAFRAGERRLSIVGG